MATRQDRHVDRHGQQLSQSAAATQNAYETGTTIVDNDLAIDLTDNEMCSARVRPLGYDSLSTRVANLS